MSGYGILNRRNIPHFPKKVEPKLILEKWFKDFEMEIEFESMPFLRQWYRERFAELNSSAPYPDEKWKRTIAFLGLLDTKFASMALPIPAAWINGYPNALKYYSLSNVRNLPLSMSEIYELDESYSHPERAYYETEENPWELRRKLAGEYVDLFLNRIRASANSETSKTEEVIKKNSELRNFVKETALYNSVSLSSAFYEKLPVFEKEFSKAKNPAVQLALSVLHRRFVDGNSIDVDLILKLFDFYFKALGGMVKGEAMKVVEIIKSEVADHLKELKRENKRLNRKIKSFN